MENNAQEVLKNEMQEIYVHFDTNEHYISLDNFMQTIRTYDEIANNFSESLFKTKRGVKLYILPPEPGSFLMTIGIMVGTTILTTIFADEFKGFIKGLTKSKKFPDGYNLGDGGELFGEMLKEFMEKTSEEIDSIEKMLPKNTNIDAAIKAKSDFYIMCSRNKNINGIGFDKTNKDILKRCDFISRSLPPKIKPLPDKEEYKELIIVKSVNTDEDLQWDFKDLNTKESFSANIEDEEFNAKLLNGQCPLKQKATPDIILALVEFRKKLENGKERKEAYIVKEIYKFNNKKLKTLPDNFKLNRVKRVSDNGQTKLFDTDAI